MSSGAIMLAVISVVALGDMLIGLHYRSLAERSESSEKVATGIDPIAARKLGTILILFAPLMWFIFALISFGVIPTGIDPIQF
jgi:hypothetical protein